MRDQFRLDIQGLRAIAILAVVIFHIDPAKLPGGFIGVDLFFVISGYLITGHILRDLERSTFSLRNFYLKRIRRLYPALMAMIAFTAAGVYFLYLPEDARSFGASLIATSVYASNIFFYTQSDYFDDKIHSNPLLHTWSLSVEEQFYILFPVLLFFLYKKAPAKLFVILAAMGALAFVVSEIVLRIDASAAFYLSPTRFGQFIAGALVALAAPCAMPKWTREGISWAGLALMGASILFFSESTPFPGFMSMVPTLGAALVIYAGSKPDLFTGKLLSLWPAQFLGKISYSLYLFHWPLVLFYKYYFASEFHGVDKIIIFALCIAAGYLSWRFIETPGLRLDFKTPAFYKGVIAVSIMSIVLGASFVATNGYANRFTTQQQAISKYLDYEYKNLDENCSLSSKSLSPDDYDEEKCLSTVPGKINILLIGDSHAAHLYSGLQAEFPEAHIAQATSSGCRPLLSTGGEERCLTFRKRLFKDYLPSHHYDMIIMSGRWRAYEVKHVKETIAALKKFTPNILVSGPIIEYSGSLPRLMGISQLRGDDGDIIDKARKFDKIVKTDAKMEKIVRQSGAAYFSPLQTLCDGNECRVTADKDTPMQFDYGHLTHEGARVLAAKMRKSGVIVTTPSAKPTANIH